MSNKGTLVTHIDSIKDEIYTYFASCPMERCTNGLIVKGSNYCSKCGVKLEWPKEARE